MPLNDYDQTVISEYLSSACNALYRITLVYLRISCRVGWQCLPLLAAKNSVRSGFFRFFFGDGLLSVRRFFFLPLEMIWDHVLVHTGWWFGTSFMTSIVGIRWDDDPI